MKRFLSLLLAVVLCLSLCACGKSEAATAFEEKVGQIGTVTVDSEAAIVAAEKAYTALSDDDKEVVAESYATLTAMRSELDALIAAAEVSNAIDSIGTVTLDSKEAIDAARAQYEALSSNEKALVSNYSALEAAEAEYDALVAAQMAAHAEEVSNAIDAIGTVTLDSKDAIEAAKTLYNALTDEEKALVTNYGTLEAAEAEYDVLWEAERQRVIQQYSYKFEIDRDPVDGITWYMHNNMPDYIDIRSYIIPYIGVRNNQPWICIRYNYTGDSWIFWESLTIVVDGTKYYKNVGYFNTTRDNDTEVWEFYDECLYIGQGMDTEEIKMLEAIANSNETIIRFQGDNYHYDLYVTNQDKQMIRDTLTLYEALLG